MAKMDFTKIIRLRRTSKPKGGYNSLWLIRCNICGEIILRWDTDMYNRACPVCNNAGVITKKDKKEIKENIFRIQRRLYSEYKSSNVLSTKEVGLLSSFRETEFNTILEDLISDYWFLPKHYEHPRRKEWMIDERGKKLIKTPDFIDLLKQCYLLIN